MPNNRKRPVTPEDFYLLKTVSDPQLSPDGKRVTYVVSQADKESDEMRSSIFVGPADGQTRARAFTQGKRDSSPRWSPDGRYLAFVSKRGDDEPQLLLAPLEGGEPRALTTAKFGVSPPAWSPDGKRIAYVARTGDYKPTKERNAVEKNAPRVIRDLRYKLDGVGFYDQRRSHVFVIDVETCAETQVAHGDYENGQPAWSPDGKWIAFVSDRERDRFQRFWGGDVWVVSAAGGRARQLTRMGGRAGAPAFSPDGRLIGFIGHENGVEGSSRNQHLYVVPAAGGKAPRSLSASLDRSPPDPRVSPGRTFSWSRDGRSVLFLADDRGARSLYRTGLANGSVSKVLGGDRQITGFDLTPDGRSIVFSSVWLSQPQEIYVAPLGGGRERNLSHANDAFARAVDLSPARRMTYKGADGWEIEALVLYPRAFRRGRPSPTALQIHGGPHGYHPMPAGATLVQYQSMVAAGYVVLLPNPRG